MPKMIGNRPRNGSLELVDNAGRDRSRTCLTYAQQLLLAPEDVCYSLDTTDKGGPHSYAKRWYRWFAAPSVILNCPHATKSMCKRANTTIAREAYRAEKRR